ncbi:MFS transporter [Lactobacillus sp. Sy-1]|uniref:MFS transporter n=1 Tax=Lactobacillus sp. Sy-1 TaxID=2109645 RepID=UPI001C5A69B7|nr:MFS transporter [Lactobacillus sp. Sy-1]MBW1605876.1 MFS transporter [Lactobacillus sp. Sy-1]
MDNQSGLALSDKESNLQILKAIASNGLGAFSFGIFEYGISFMLLHATKSPLSFGMGLIVAPLMSLLFFIPIGNFVDTHNHKRIIFWGFLLRLIGFALLAIALPHFHGIGLLIPVGIFIAVDSLLVNIRNTAYMASIKQLVNTSQVAKLTSLNTACSSASRILSPIFGVILYSLISVEGLIVVEMVATMIALAIMMSLQFYDNEPIEKTAQNASQLEQFKETIHYMKKRPFIRDTIIAEIVVNFFFTAIVTGSPFIIVNELHMSNQTVAFVETGYSIGYLLGSLVTSLLKRQRHFAAKVLVSMVTVGFALFGLGVLFASHPSSLMVCIFGLLLALLMDFAFAIFDLAIEIRLQSTVHTRILGRVSSTLYTASFAIMPVGTLVYTFLFDVFKNGSYVMVVSGVLMIIYACVSIPMFVRDIKRDDQFLTKRAK